MRKTLLLFILVNFLCNGLSSEENTITIKRGITLQNAMFVNLPYNKPFHVPKFADHDDDPIIENDDVYLSNSFLNIVLLPDTYNNNKIIIVEIENGNKKYTKELGSLYIEEINSKKYYSTNLCFQDTNLVSTNREWNIKLINKITGKTFFEKKLYTNQIESKYIVDYTSDDTPFNISVAKNMQTNTSYHLRYISDKNTICVIYYGYDNDLDHDLQLFYIPILAFKSDNISENVATVEISASYPGQYYIEFYNSMKNEVFSPSYLYYLGIDYPYDKKIESNPNTIETLYVNSPEGLNIRDFPKGAVIKTLPDRQAVKRLHNPLIVFEDVIDGIKSYWVPVEVENNDQSSRKELYGWVFAGYLTKEIE